MTASSVRLVDSVPWEADGFASIVAKLIDRECGGKSVILIGDMVEQHYRKERLPSVGLLDRSKVLDRRLSVAFPGYPVRAALPLKDKRAALGKADGKTTGQKAGAVYLFAAVPGSEIITKTLDAVERSTAAIGGLGLLPIEAADMVTTLSNRLFGEETNVSPWTIFIGQHHGGGLRQIVTRGGDLALTRMTPVIDSDMEPEVWARDVISEFNATMGYLSRFGFDEEDGLNIVIISGPGPMATLEKKLQEKGRLAVMSVSEAAGMLGINLNWDDDQRYADPLHVGWVGRKSKLALPMSSSRLTKVAAPRQSAYVLSWLLAVCCVWLGWEIFTGFGHLMSLQTETDRVKLQQRDLDIQLEEYVQNKNLKGIDFTLIRNTISLYENLTKEGFPIDDAFRKIGAALNGETHLQSVKIDKPSGGLFNQPVEQDWQETPPEVKAQPYDVRLGLAFPPDTLPEDGVVQVNGLQERLRQAFPGQAVTVTKQVADLSYTGNFTGESGDQPANARASRKTLEAEITISGAFR